MLDIHWSCQNLLLWAGIVRHRLSANQIFRCAKLKKLENCMRYQVDFLLSLKLQKISCYLGLCCKILLANQFAGLFTFDLFDLLILITKVHCYIVLAINLWTGFTTDQLSESAAYHCCMLHEVDLCNCTWFTVLSSNVIFSS